MLKKLHNILLAIKIGVSKLSGQPMYKDNTSTASPWWAVTEVSAQSTLSQPSQPQQSPH